MSSMQVPSDRGDRGDPVLPRGGGWREAARTYGRHPPGAPLAMCAGRKKSFEKQISRTKA